MRIAFNFILLILIPLPLYSQAHIGFIGGVNYTNYSGFGNTDFKTDFHIGFALEMKVSENIYFQPEFLYSKKGAKIETAKYPYVNNNIEVNYFSIPLTMVVNPVKFLVFQFGPEINTYLSDNFNNSTSQYLINMNPIDVAALVGLGFQIDNTIRIMGRYSHGYSKNFRTTIVNQNSSNTKESGKSQTYQITVAVFFK